MLIIGDREALGWILMSGQTAFRDALRPELQAIAAGDLFYLYTTRGCFKNPGRDRGRVIGTAKVLSAISKREQPILFGDRMYSVGCKLHIDRLVPMHQGVELAPLAESLDTLSRFGQNWAAGLRRPIVPLSPLDASRLDDLLLPLEAEFGKVVEEYAHWYNESDAKITSHS